MLGALRTSAARAARTAAQNVRRMSSGVSVEEEIKEMNKWRIVSYAAIPTCVGLAAYILANEHPHHRGKVEYPYMNYKVRDFPWGPNPLIGCPEEH